MHSDLRSNKFALGRHHQFRTLNKVFALGPRTINAGKTITQICDYKLFNSYSRVPT